ncbi:MAG: acyl-CoA thioesterase [Pseudomonadota bacterium]
MVYPVIRATALLLRSRRDPEMSPDTTVRTPMTCRPWDVDMFLEMNNGRHLTLFDLGRFDQAVRLGLFQLTRERGWGFVVGGASVQYRRRIRAFQRFEIATRCLARDDKWFYIEQVTWRRETACSAALLRVAVVAGSRGTVPTQDVAEAMGYPDWHGTLPEWADRWESADRTRPWPPVTGQL